MDASPSEPPVSDRFGVDQLVQALAEGVRRGESVELVRVVAHWYGDLGSQQPVVVERAIADDPGSCGDPRWDAMVAGLVERLARRHGKRVPPWTAAPDKFLRSWWFVSPFRSLHASALVDTPPELANRGVFIHRASLTSV